VTRNSDEQRVRERLRYLVAHEGLSVLHAAKRLGLSYTTVRRLLGHDTKVVKRKSPHRTLRSQSDAQLCHPSSAPVFTKGLGTALRKWLRMHVAVGMYDFDEVFGRLRGPAQRIFHELVTEQVLTKTRKRATNIVEDDHEEWFVDDP
jgi:hypothetical protein